MPIRADHEERTKVITLQEVGEMKGQSHVVIDIDVSMDYDSE